MRIDRALVFVLVSVIGLAILAAVGQARAETVLVVDTDFAGSALDLLPNLNPLESAEPRTVVPLPPDERGVRAQMPLEASRLGRSVHHWRVLHLKNTQGTPAEMLLVVPHRQFSGSGLFWPRPSGSQVSSFQLSTAELVRPIRTPGFDVLAMTLSPSSAISYGLELNGPSLGAATLWKRAAWELQSLSRAFFNGAVLGIGILLAIASVALFLLRRRSVFPAAALFTITSVAFIAMGMGYLAPLAAPFAGFAQPYDVVRGLIEAAMTAAAALLLVTLLDLRTRQPAMAGLLFTAVGAAMALGALALFLPSVAVGLNRLLFAFVVAVGLVLAFALRNDGLKNQTARLVWAMLGIWTVVAALDCLGYLPGDGISPITSALLILVLVVLAVSTSQLAIGPRLAARRSMDEMARRALALANSEQSVWDWQIDRRSLNVGGELERALGLAPGTIAGGGMDSWNEVIHPADRSPFAAALEAARRRRRGGLSLEFRLRRADGSYRWYNLRGRVIPGESGEAERIVGAIADVTALRRAEDRLLFDAVRDRVTALPNRPLFLDRLERAMRQSLRGLYCVVIDIDRFRAVNDSLGHEVGDSLLHVTARRLSTLNGPEGTLARLTGDQFGLVVHAERARDVLALARELRAVVSEPVRIRGQDIFLTASVGIAASDNGRGSPEELLRDAEIALYEAKRRGKDMTEVFRPEMRDERLALVAMEQDLAQAVEKGEIDVVYQPIVRVNDGQLAGFEALARWRRSNGEIVEPSRFIAVAEDTGAIRAVGRFVLSEAARQLGSWQRAFRPSDPLFVAVNVSSRQLIGNELVDDLKAIMAREDIRPHTLKIELTESIVMENPELSSKVLSRLRSLGVGLACDDFGTGYSSLANLRRLPFDTLKVDRSFIDVDMEDEQAAIILESIILLAHDLGLTVVAEGVENTAQMGRLVEFECDFAQGYYIGEPATAAEVTEALGGVPFQPGARRGGISGWWDRVTRREPQRPPVVTPQPYFPPLPAPEPLPARAEEEPRPVLAPEPLPESPPLPPAGTAPMAPRVRPGQAPLAPRPPRMAPRIEQPAPERPMEPTNAPLPEEAAEPARLAKPVTQPEPLPPSAVPPEVAEEPAPEPAAQEAAPPDVEETLEKPVSAAARKRAKPARGGSKSATKAGKTARKPKRKTPG